MRQCEPWRARAPWPSGTGAAYIGAFAGPFLRHEAGASVWGPCGSEGSSEKKNEGSPLIGNGASAGPSAAAPFFCAFGDHSATCCLWPGGGQFNQGVVVGRQGRSRRGQAGRGCLLERPSAEQGLPCGNPNRKCICPSRSTTKHSVGGPSHLAVASCTEPECSVPRRTLA